LTGYKETVSQGGRTMYKTETSLLDILKGEFCNSTECPPKNLALAEMEDIIYLAKEHTVQGLIANAAMQGRIVLSASDNGDKEAAVLKLMTVKVQYQRNFFHFEDAVTDFAQLMKRHGLRYVVFKGVAVARLYPVPYSRTMGDVDFYVPASDFAHAVEVIERELHVDIEKEDIDKHYSFDYQGIRFEMHYQIETFGNERHQKYFNRMIDECITQRTDCFSITDSETGSGETMVSVLPPTEDLVVVFKHWFNHLLVEGVGLRQTTDLAVLLKAYQDKMDVAHLMTALENIGYKKAFRAMLAMMRKYFGLEWVESFCVLNSKDERYADKLMATVMESGNFGRKAYKNHSSGRKKSIETAKRALRHCAKFFWLAPKDICCLVPKRIGITLKQKI